MIKCEMSLEFGIDSSDYHILADAAESVVRVPGVSLEIGVREGGSSKIIIDSFLRTHQGRAHVAIDPYGGIPYKHKENITITDNENYRNNVRDAAIPSLFLYCAGTSINFIYYQMTDTQFMEKFTDGVPVYAGAEEMILNEYALVFFDGPHCVKSVMAEAVFFAERSVLGTHFVFDDVAGDYYDHSRIHNYLLTSGWVVKRWADAKISYVRI